MASRSMTWICYAFSLPFFCPPLGVFLQEGFGKHFWINIVLTIFGYIPGIVHAVWIIARK